MLDGPAAAVGMSALSQDVPSVRLIAVSRGSGTREGRG